LRKTVDPKRVTLLRKGDLTERPVLYWMNRDQRVKDNWALLYAQETALRLKQPLIVVFCLVPDFLGATIRHYGFMLRGLQGVEEQLYDKQIPFRLLTGEPHRELPAFVKKHDIGLLVTDFDPLRIKRVWKEKIMKNIAVPFHEVDAHNIVPCHIASSQREYAAYTIRPKIHKRLSEFLTIFPRLKEHPHRWKEKPGSVSWDAITKGLAVDRSVTAIDWIRPGEKAARKILRSFINKGLSSYNEQRNDPNAEAQSGLSPYLHFGQLSAQRVALEVMKSAPAKDDRDAFLEELIVRRELSDNFCFYSDNYDSVEAFPEWAKKTLDRHRKDRREYRYTRDTFEKAATHDELWNAAQKEMILEWTASPEEAMQIAIYLNDRYELDGRDPNGYTGIAWSIGGVHDRAWNERPVFGKIRYMSYNGCRSKFDVPRYIAAINGLKQ
jgi:deoxyribodipyrimidine photo-lyase